MQIADLSGRALRRAVTHRLFFPRRYNVALCMSRTLGLPVIDCYAVIDAYVGGTVECTTAPQHGGPYTGSKKMSSQHNPDSPSECMQRLRAGAIGICSGRTSPYPGLMSVYNEIQIEDSRICAILRDASKLLCRLWKNSCSHSSVIHISIALCTRCQRCR